MIAWTTAREVPFEWVYSATQQRGTSAITVGTTRNQTGATTVSGTASTTSQITRNRRTSTTQTYQSEISVSYTFTVENFAWTTASSLNSKSQETTTFTFAEIGERQSYFTSLATRQATRTTTTNAGTTMGNALDTVYLADQSEILWKINENPAWSSALTDNAVSGERFTLSQNLVSVELFSGATSQSTIQGSAASGAHQLTIESNANFSVTINNAPGIIGGATAAITLPATSSRTTFQSRTSSSQPQVVHNGNTETAPLTTSFFGTATQTDLLLGVSWQRIGTSYGTTRQTVSVPNLNLDSNVQGNTVKESFVIGGRSAIGFAPTMWIVSPAGVAMGNSSGLLYGGTGIEDSVIDIQEQEVTFQFVPTARDGALPPVTTISPIPRDNFVFTLESNSVTFVGTTEEDGVPTTTTKEGEFSLSGQTWLSVVSRPNLLGGNLKPRQTGHMRIVAGLYKNQTGGTSWFDGNDTTYTGTRATTYWVPISYVSENNAQSVFAVPRNTTRWPTFTSMP